MRKHVCMSHAVQLMSTNLVVHDLSETSALIVYRRQPDPPSGQRPECGRSLPFDQL